MYSHVFAIQFEKSITAAAQVGFLAALFELPVIDGGLATDVYWCMLDHEGFCEFYSNTPRATELLSRRIGDAEQQGLLKQVNPGIGSAFRFCSRIAAGILASAMRAIFLRGAARSL
jgi:hypothetical protein